MSEPIKFKTSMTFEYAVPREMAPGILRVVANNPSPFTFKGTNTYIVGTTELAIIDAGPGADDPGHVAAVMKAVAGRPVSHILMTHTHHDHLDSLAELVAATGAKTCGFGRQARAAGAKKTSHSGSEYVELSFDPDIKLRDGDQVQGAGWRFTALHTPGHAPDHLCYDLDGRHILFSGDHVMGWNTSIVAPPEGRMADYMRSLERLLPRHDAVYFPGHGGRVEMPQRLVRAFLVHRGAREAAILAAIREGKTSIRTIAEVVYRGLDARLMPAASLSVQAHVEHLLERGLVRLSGQLSSDHALASS